MGGAGRKAGCTLVMAVSMSIAQPLCSTSCPTAMAHPSSGTTNPCPRTSALALTTWGGQRVQSGLVRVRALPMWAMCGWVEGVDRSIMRYAMHAAVAYFC